MSVRAPLAAAAAALALCLAGAAPVLAHGDDEARAEGTCGSGADAELRLKADHGAIRVEFEVDSRRARERWRIVLVHERRVVWRGRARTRDGGSFRIRRSVPDFDGADAVSVRAAGPRGNTCQASATLTAAQG